MNNWNLGFSTASAPPMANTASGGQAVNVGGGASFGGGVSAGSGAQGGAGLAVILGLLVVGYIATRRLQGSLSI